MTTHTEHGFFDVDKVTDGLHEQELTIVAARPRCWKNSICITNSRACSRKGSIYIFCKFRNVRKTITEIEL